MSTDAQVRANQLNAQASSGPVNTEKSRFNALKYGLTSECAFNEREKTVINNVYDDLCQLLKPQNRLQQFLVGRMAIYIWRLQKSAHIENTYFRNSVISARNTKKLNDTFEDTMGRLAKIEEKLLTEQIDTPIDLVMRYETSNENRLIKLFKFYRDSKE